MTAVLVVALVALAYALIATRLDRWSIGAPLVFMATGALAVVVVHDGAPSAHNHGIQLVTEATLALVLFADASTVRLHQLGHDVGLPLRLLGIGLPLTFILGTVAGDLLLGAETWAAAALLAAILTPTDAALSLPVVTNPAVPSRVRRMLNVESGLNDGIVTPVVTVLLAVVAAEEELQAGWVTAAVREVGVAIVVAILVGGCGGLLLRVSDARGWTSELSVELAVLALAALSYVGAVWSGGNGFVAAFAAGLFFAAASGGGFRRATGFTETIGVFLSFAVWAMFGAAFVEPVLRETWDWRVAGYALLSLTIVRMAPVAIALVGTRLLPGTVAFTGWFGPRGLASVVFLTMAVDELGLGIGSVLVRTATLTIAASVVLHGLTARPLVTRYAANLARHPDAPELRPGPEPHMRRRLLT